MKIIRTVADWQHIRSKLDDLAIGFIPTMGALHVGHAALLQAARTENAIVVLSIFVNPTQFDETADYEHYPSTIAADLKLAECAGVDYVLLPTKAAMYPESMFYSINTTHPVADQLEGACRPGHFSGVLTIVMKLLQWIRPQRAYFGEKDYQQLLLIRSMVAAFFMPVEIVACPIVRETSGLPYSSRNARLSSSQRQQIDIAYKYLHQLGDDQLEQGKQTLQDMGLQVDYLSVFAGRIFSAIRLGNIRLIDNFIVED